MNAEQMYEHMKEALRFFGLSFHEKDKVTVSFSAGCIVFIYGKTLVTIYEDGSV